MADLAKILRELPSAEREAFSLETLRAMVGDLYGTRGQVKIGGGSEARFTLIKQA